MKIRLLCAIWTTDTSTGQALGEAQLAKHLEAEAPDIGKRLELVQNNASRAATWMGRRKQTAPSKLPTLEVFIAPEYLFSKHHDELLQGAHEKRQVEEASRKISEKFGLLAIPGTITWRKPLEREDDPERHHPEAEKIESRRDKALRRMEHDLTVRAGHVERDLVHPKPDAALRKGWLEQRDTPMIKAAEQALLTHPPEGLKYDVAMNTAFVHYRGERLLKYHKRGNSAEVLARDNAGDTLAVFVPGERDGYFVVPLKDPAAKGASIDVECGLEICYDHRIGYLSNSQLGKTPHIQFITSAFVEVEKPSIKVRAGGVVVHASSQIKVSGVFNALGEPVKATAAEGGESGALLYYDLDLSID